TVADWESASHSSRAPAARYTSRFAPRSSARVADERTSTTRSGTTSSAPWASVGRRAAAHQARSPAALAQPRPKRRQYIDAGARVVLGPDLIQLARGADESHPVAQLARQPLRALAEQVRETVTLSVVARDGQLDVVDQVDGPHQIRPGDWVGHRFPLHASSTGKILLASLDDARL